ncbi:MAG: hypothetical protein HY773_01510 [Candidatus Terrybacteria bacterium]|nr:hypothetical protein [Candidatus Terrybacteria bacterium]
MPEDKLSFIPKKTFTGPVYKSKGPGLFLAFSFLALLISGAFYGGLFFYRNTLQKKITSLSSSLERAKIAFELPLINELFTISEKIDSSKTLLSQHRTLLPIFDLLEKLTLKDVRFKSFRFSFSKESGPLVLMDGQTRNYSTLASQGEIFGKDKNIKKVSFSNLSLGSKGLINFTIHLNLEPSLLSYKGD